MVEFVRFRVEDLGRFKALQRLVFEIASVKNTPPETDPELDYDIAKLRSLLPPEVEARFDWPEGADLDAARVDHARPLKLGAPGAYLGDRWPFVRLIDLIEDSEYDIATCELVDEGVAELRVDAQAYPYGGLNPMAAIVEAFGFVVLGISDAGRFTPASAPR